MQAEIDDELLLLPLLSLPLPLLFRYRYHYKLAPRYGATAVATS